MLYLNIRKKLMKIRNKNNYKNNNKTEFKDIIQSQRVIHQ